MINKAEQTTIKETGGSVETPVQVDLKDIQFVQNSLRLQSETNIGSYSLPIRMGGKIETLRMSVQSQFSDETTLAISLTTPRYGNVDAFVKIMYGYQLDMYISSDDGALQTITDHKALADILDNQGFALKTIMQKGENDDIIESSYAYAIDNYRGIDSITRNNLFTIATCFTQYLESL